MAYSPSSGSGLGSRSGMSMSVRLSNRFPLADFYIRRWRGPELGAAVMVHRNAAQARMLVMDRGERLGVQFDYLVATATGTPREQFRAHQFALSVSIKSPACCRNPRCRNSAQ